MSFGWGCYRVVSEPKHKDETIPASVHEVSESSTSPFLREDMNGLFPVLRWYINSLLVNSYSFKDDYAYLDVSKVETAAIKKLVEKLGNAEEKTECKKLKKELEEARFSNTFLRMQNK
ncbi:hypothetical protein Tco_1371388 [Tanacetum coccineum]